MDVTSTQRFVRISARKVRDLTQRISGLPAAEALRIAGFSERKGAYYVTKALESAIANAKNNAKLPEDSLWVRNAEVGEGPKMRRFWARSRGAVSPVRKRLCHISIVLTDETKKGKGEKSASKKTASSGKE